MKVYEEGSLVPGARDRGGGGCGVSVEGRRRRSRMNR